MEHVQPEICYDIAFVCLHSDKMLFFDTYIIFVMKLSRDSD